MFSIFPSFSSNCSVVVASDLNVRYSWMFRIIADTSEDSHGASKRNHLSRFLSMNPMSSCRLRMISTMHQFLQHTHSHLLGHRSSCQRLCMTAKSPIQSKLLLFTILKLIMKTVKLSITKRLLRRLTTQQCFSYPFCGSFLYTKVFRVHILSFVQKYLTTFCYL